MKSRRGGDKKYYSLANDSIKDLWNKLLPKFDKVHWDEEKDVSKIIDAIPGDISLHIVVDSYLLKNKNLQISITTYK